jgi:Flp pilus assembly protein TadG
LAIVLAAASAAAVAQQADQTAHAELMRRADAAAKAACPQVDSAGRTYRWNTNDTSCAAKEADGGLEQPPGVIAAVRTNDTARTNGTIRTTRVIPD